MLCVTMLCVAMMTRGSLCPMRSVFFNVCLCEVQIKSSFEEVPLLGGHPAE